jgi:hypothetical protein
LAEDEKVDMLGVRYKFVNFGAGKSPGLPMFKVPGAAAGKTRAGSIGAGAIL